MDNNEKEISDLILWVKKKRLEDSTNDMLRYFLDMFEHEVINKKDTPLDAKLRFAFKMVGAKPELIKDVYNDVKKRS